MEGVTANVYKGIRGYWRRRGYEKINGSGGGGRRRKNRVELAVEGSSSTRKRRFWRIKLTPKLKLKLRFSPKKFVLGLRDAYVNFMTRLASTRFVSTGIAGFAGEGIDGFGMRPLKEYDERMLIEIYKSMLMAQGQLIPRDGTTAIATTVSCRR